MGSELQPAFDYFRFCTNEAIRIAAQKQNTSKFSLHKELYLQLRSDFYSKYVYGALVCAAAKLKQYKKAKRKKQDAKLPHVWKNMLFLDNQTYKIKDGVLRFPIKPSQHVRIRLAPYVLRQLKNVMMGAITVTPNKLVISYSKQIIDQKPSDFLAIDVNLYNATTCNTQNKFATYNLQRASQIKQTYREVKSKFKRNDIRIRKRIFSKYGNKERNRVHDIIHKTSKKIVNQNMGIILEDLKGIRKLYQKGNGQGRKYRAKMNSWSFFELQRQVKYKARWLGLPIKYVNAAGTSSKCAVCGSKTVPEEHRMLFCPCCNVAVDRDINAAKNILARGIRDVPVAVQGEAMKQSKDVEQIVPNQVTQQLTKT